MSIRMNADTFRISEGALRMEAGLVPWDMAAFNFPVAHISAIEVGNVSDAQREWSRFSAWLDATGARIASCRLDHQRLAESMFLEQHGFRFVEMVLHPYVMLDAVDRMSGDLHIELATQADLPALRRIAETSFSHERYHVDPRLDKRLADIRYGRWVESALNHPQQRLFKLVDEGVTVALFVTEDRGSDVYWHLTAIAPECQGKGYGRRAWTTMLAHHQVQGRRKLSTTISARNSAVLSLYSHLQFKFSAPDMSFHWVR